MPCGCMPKYFVFSVSLDNVASHALLRRLHRIEPRSNSGNDVSYFAYGHQANMWVDTNIDAKISQDIGGLGGRVRLMANADKDDRAKSAKCTMSSLQSVRHPHIPRKTDETELEVIGVPLRFVDFRRHETMTAAAVHPIDVLHDCPIRGEVHRAHIEMHEPGLGRKSGAGPKQLP